MKKIKIRENSYDCLKEFVDTDMTLSNNMIPKNLGGNSEITTSDKMSDDETTDEPLTTDKHAKQLYRNYLIGSQKPLAKHSMVKEDTNTIANDNLDKIPSIDTISQHVVKDKLDKFLESLYATKDKPKDMAVILNFIVETFMPYIQDMTTKTIIRNKIK